MQGKDRIGSIEVISRPIYVVVVGGPAEPLGAQGQDAESRAVAQQWEVAPVEAARTQAESRAITQQWEATAVEAAGTQSAVEAATLQWEATAVQAARPQMAKATLARHQPTPGGGFRATGTPSPTDGVEKSQSAVADGAPSVLAGPEVEGSVGAWRVVGKCPTLQYITQRHARLAEATAAAEVSV